MNEFFFFRRGFLKTAPSEETGSSPVNAPVFNDFFPEDPEACSFAPPGGANKETILDMADGPFRAEIRWKVFWRRSWTSDQTVQERFVSPPLDPHTA